MLKISQFSVLNFEICAEKSVVPSSYGARVDDREARLREQRTEAGADRVAVGVVGVEHADLLVRLHLPFHCEMYALAKSATPKLKW